MVPRPSTVFIVAAATAALLGTAEAAHAHLRRRAMQPDLVRQVALVGRLDLTDLCLTTEARYTRHPTQADVFSAFQDHPLALEHFPSGSWIQVPR